MEAAGLAIGGLGLASLFQTCIDFINYFQVARNLVYDHELATTKIGLLEARLRRWGSHMQVLHPGQEDGCLRERWSEEGDIVARSLKGVAEILGNTSQLTEKYGFYKKRALTWHSLPLFTRRVVRKKEPVKHSIQHTISFCKQVSWAIRDKRKFDSFILELDFFVTNLEKVGRRLSDSSESYHS
jgi:hypothetical protein